MFSWTITSAIATLIAAGLTMIAIIVASCIYKSSRDHNYYIEIMKDIKQFRIMTSKRIKEFRQIRSQFLNDLRVNERLYNIIKNVLNEEDVRYEDIPRIEGIKMATIKDKYDILTNYFEDYIKELIPKHEAVAVNYTSLPHLLNTKFPLTFYLISNIVDKYYQEIQVAIINQARIPNAVFDLTGFNIARSFTRIFNDNNILPKIIFLSNNINLYLSVNNELALLCSRLLHKPFNNGFNNFRKYMGKESKIKIRNISLEEALTNYKKIYKDDNIIDYYSTFTNLNTLTLKILSLKYKHEKGMFIISGYVYKEETEDDNVTNLNNKANFRIQYPKE